MNKIALSVIALAALSTASFAAGNRSYDLQDLQSTNFYSSSGITQPVNGSTEQAALAVGQDSAVTAYERQIWRAMEREHGDR